MKYSGSCQCGRVAFEVEGEIDQAMACNCSMCQRKGSLLWFAPRTQFEFKTAEDAAGTYLFHKHVIKHRFCRVCGIHPYAEADHPKTGVPTAAINVRCIDGIDLNQIKIVHVDGRSF